MDFNSNKYAVKSHAQDPFVEPNLKTIPQTNDEMQQYLLIYFFGYKHAVELYDFFLIFFWRRTV